MDGDVLTVTRADSWGPARLIWQSGIFAECIRKDTKTETGKFCQFVIMPRKNNARNPLQVRLRARSLPKGTSPKKFYRRLIEHMTTGRPLPSSWEVEIGWRNPGTIAGRTKHWQYDNFEDAVADSREGFNGLLHSVLVSQLRKLV